MWEYKLIASNEFYHAGIPGMKWYKRRYQYEDGTYTAEGKARRRVGDGYGDGPSKTNGNGSVKGNVSQLKKERAKKPSLFSRRTKKVKQEERIKSLFDKMSDEDLKKLVERMRLEKQAKDLSREEEKQKPEHKVWSKVGELAMVFGKNALESIGKSAGELVVKKHIEDRINKAAEKNAQASRDRLAKLTKSEPAKSEPAKKEPAKQEPAKKEPVKQEAPKKEPEKKDPEKKRK